MANNEYEFFVSGNAPWLYPTDTLFGLLWYSEESSVEIPKKIPFCGEWGVALSNSVMLLDKYPMPSKLSIVWLSIVEESYYEVESLLPKSQMESLWEHEKQTFSHIVVGMAPYGQISVWLYGLKKSIIIKWIQGNRVDVDLNDYLSTELNLHQYCESLLSDREAKINLQQNGLPPRDLFDNYMKQFTYRYTALFEHWNEDKNVWQKYDDEEIIPEFDYIEDTLFDGTHDKLHDGGLMNYHQAGKPKKLAVKWHIKKSDYTAYFWFEDEEIRNVFDRFYGTHPETKTDFMIRIDSENKKFELALYRYGLKEPVVIKKSAYQLIVFKNKFEYFRSENYNQPRGAWIW